MEQEQVIGDDLEKTQVDSVDSGNDDKVDHKTFQRLLTQRKADQVKMREMQSIIETVPEKEARLAKLEEEKNRAEGNWKAVLESRESELEKLKSQNSELTEKVSTFESEFQKSVKLEALQKAMGAKISNPSYFGLVDYDKIPVGEDGKVDEIAVNAYAKSFAEEHSRLLETSKPRVETRAPDGGSGFITHAEWLEIAKTDPKKARELMGNKKVKK